VPTARRLSVVFLFLCICLPAAAAGLEISRLRCESLVGPLGLTETKPRLSWEVASDRRGARQSAWQIRVATSAEKLAAPDLWDSNRVESAETTGIVYAGKPLRSDMAVFWQVRAWDEKKEASAWSGPATWTMGLLAPGDWTAAWIGLPAPPPESGTLDASTHWIAPAGIDPANAPAGPFRYRRTISFDPASTRQVLATIAGDDRFRAWINDRHFLSGGGHAKARRLDITGYLDPGENTLAIEVVNGATGPTALLCRIEEIPIPGATTPAKPSISANAGGWKAARDAAPGWRKPEFDASSWKPASDAAPAGGAPQGEIRWTDAAHNLPARMLRREFDFKKEIRRATVHLTGLGYHELHINGRKVGDQVLEPALVHYDVRVPVSTYDVTALLHPGANAVGILLGNGRYMAPDFRIRPNTLDYGVPVARAQIHIEFADGSRKTIGTATDWQATDAGPVRANNDYDGETYDARLEMPGWSEPGFDATHWQKAAAMPAPKGTPRNIACPPTRVTERIQPVKVTEPRPGVFVFDFGQNLVGWCRLKTTGERGTEIRIRHAETLREDGMLATANLRGAMAADRYILSGAADAELWEPRFAYHGFRYAEVVGLPAKPGPDTLEACVVHSDLPSASTWKSSNETLDAILANVRRGVEGNYRSIPTDCPQRDERQGWLGDRAAESRGEAYLFDISAFYSKWLDDIRDAQKPDGLVPDVCPPYWPMNSGSAVWPAALAIVPQSLHDIYGDRRAAERNYDAVAKWLRFQLARRDAAGLLPADPYGDWCPPPKDPDLIHAVSPEVVTDKRFVANLYLAKNLSMAAWMAPLAGHESETAGWLEARKPLVEAIIKTWWNPETSAFANGTQTTSALALAFGIAGKDRRPALARSLVARIRTTDKGHIGTGLIGAQWLMRTLDEIGHSSLAFELATQRSYPSWGYMVEHDATTVWELWNGNTADPAMNSGNHVMLVGDLVTWCYERLAGIRPAAPGFSKLLMHPEPVGGLSFVDVEYRSVRGPVRNDLPHSARPHDSGDPLGQISLPGPLRIL